MWESEASGRCTGEENYGKNSTLRERDNGWKMGKARIMREEYNREKQTS